MATNLLFMGELDIHEKDFLPFLAAHDYNVTVINTSLAIWQFPRMIIGTDIPVCNLYEKDRIRYLFKDSVARAWILKAASGGIVERLGFSMPEIGQILKKKEIDVVYGSWGSVGLPELRFIKKFNVPVVYEFLTYPTGFSRIAEKVENFLNRSIINSLNGKVFASPIMLNYMKSTFDLHPGNNLVFTESYSKRCFYQKRLPRLSDDDDEPHLVFIGVSYDFFPQIEEILRKKIHVHACETAGLEGRLRASKFKDFCHLFKKASAGALLDGSFATFMTQFDACLVTYDFRRATSTRLYNSVPNRFSFALTAGIPFVMPKGYLKSCEDIIRRHQIGFAYVNCDELKNKLDNRDLMNTYQRNAAAKSNIFTLENNFAKIDRFLRKMACTA
jgi:hypothetical protein